MKQKQFAALALAAWLAVVGWVGSMILAKPQAFPSRFAETDDGMAAQIGLEIQQTEVLALALSMLESPPPRAGVSAIIALPPKASGAGRVEDGAALAGAIGGRVPDGEGQTAARLVSMIISGAGMAPRAMIDGALVGTGSRLGDGAIVRRIEPRAVLIRDSEGVMHTLALRLPGDPPPAPASEGSP